MFLRRLLKTPRTIGFRLTFWYSGIFILSSLLLFIIMHFLLSSTLKKQDQETVLLKLKELSTLFQKEGMPPLEKEVTIHKKFGKKDPLFIRVANPKNETLFISLPYQWTEFDIKSLEETPPSDQWTRLPARQNKNTWEVASSRLENGFWVQVGKSTEERERLMTRFRETFAGLIIPLVLLGFIGGTFLAFRALAPIRSLINTVQAIDSGNMTARVRSPQTGDELDELVRLFNKMLERIATLINAMKESLDNVAHDLRTPMTRLRSIAEVTLQSDPNREVCFEALADCLEESERVLTMLSTLMDISEAETGVMKLEMIRVDVSTLMEDVVELYRYVAEDKHIVVRNQCSRGLTVKADFNRIRQVLANLLDNALKYTTEGGAVDLEAHRSNHRIVINVRDTGIGIPAEALPRIWDRLYHYDQSRSQKGLGLGLSLVKAIVQAHKGRVDVSSESGKGSTFIIYLPADV